MELNVVEQCLNVYKTAVVQKKRLETHGDPDVAFAKLGALAEGCEIASRRLFA